LVTNDLVTITRLLQWSKQWEPCFDWGVVFIPRYGHHKLERWTSIVHFGFGDVGRSAQLLPEKRRIQGPLLSRKSRKPCGNAARSARLNQRMKSCESNGGAAYSPPVPNLAGTARRVALGNKTRWSDGTVDLASPFRARFFVRVYVSRWAARGSMTSAIRASGNAGRASARRSKQAFLTGCAFGIARSHRET